MKRIFLISLLLLISCTSIDGNISKLDYKNVKETVEEQTHKAVVKTKTLETKYESSVKSAISSGFSFLFEKNAPLKLEKAGQSGILNIKIPETRQYKVSDANVSYFLDSDGYLNVKLSAFVENRSNYPMKISVRQKIYSNDKKLLLDKYFGNYNFSFTETFFDINSNMSKTLDTDVIKVKFMDKLSIRAEDINFKIYLAGNLVYSSGK